MFWKDAIILLNDGIILKVPARHIPKVVITFFSSGEWLRETKIIKTTPEIETNSR